MVEHQFHDHIILANYCDSEVRPFGLTVFIYLLSLAGRAEAVCIQIISYQNLASNLPLI